MIKMAIKALYLQLEFNQQTRVKEMRSPMNNCLPVMRTVQDISFLTSNRREYKSLKNWRKS